MGTVALGIRHVLCVPLRLVRYLDTVEDEPSKRTSASSISIAARRDRCCRRRRAARSRRWRPKRRWRSRTRGCIARRWRRRGWIRRSGSPRRSSRRCCRGCRTRRVFRRGRIDAAVPIDRRRLLRLRGAARRLVRVRARRRRGQRASGGAAERDGAGHHRGAERVDRWSVRDAHPRQSRHAAARHRGALCDGVLWRAGAGRAGHLVQRGAQSAVRARP